MLETISIALIIEIASGLTIFGTLLHTIHKVKKDQREARENHKAEILAAALEADAKLRTAIDSRIEMQYQEHQSKMSALRKDLDNFVKSFESEIEHINEKQAGEIRNLGEKIEDLRSELRTQHGQLITLVTKLIDKD